MPDYLFLMHDDTLHPGDGGGAQGWDDYLATLRREGVFQGGSAIGGGVCLRKTHAVPAVAHHITGFVCVTAESLAQARLLVAGNPVFEAGGTVEIRELPETG